MTFLEGAHTEREEREIEIDIYRERERDEFFVRRGTSM